MKLFNILLFIAAQSIHLRRRGGGGGSHGGGGGHGGGTGSSGLSAFPPGDHCNAASACSSPAKYVAPLPIPTVIDGTSGGTKTITSSKACQQVFHNSWGNACGSPTEVWAYNGEFPGPTVVAKKGVPLNIKHVNNLGQDYEYHDISITTHHHGLHIVPAFDGHPQPDYVTDSSFAIDTAGMIYPNNDFTYETTNDQEPGTHWYHDHKMHDTGRNVVMGLAGFFLIQPNSESLYDNVRNSLPSGEYEIGLAFQDRKFTSTNQFDYPMNWDELKSSGLVNAGYFGNRMLVNGVHAPYLEVKRTWYRFRLLNGCNARQLRLEIQTSSGNRRNQIYQIGTEGGHISSPTFRSNIFVAPGERYDVLVDFSGISSNSNLYLRNTNVQSPDLPDVMQFRVVSGSVPSYSPPNSLVNYSSIWPTNPTVQRSFALQGSNSGPWTIGGLRYDPDAANLQVRRGTTERWTFMAMMSNHHHPMHLHLVQFKIDDASSGSLEYGWKDVVMIPAMMGGSRSITAHFDGEPGIYMFHCHNLEHEDYDMMLQYEICDDSNEHPCNGSLLGAFVGGGGGGMHK